MTALEVTFPDEWCTVPTPRTSAGGCTVALLPGPNQPDVVDGESPNLPQQAAGVPLRAFCAVAVVPGGDDVAQLQAVAEGGAHRDLERDTMTVELSLGRGVRSSAFRFAGELLDDETVVPFTAEVRFALPLPGHRIGVLHFETPSLACFEELECLFDMIAGTARIA